MGTPATPEPVMLICGILVARRELMPEVRRRLEEAFGPARLESEPIPFVWTKYYESEMGPDITRLFLAFENLICPGEIARIKLQTNAIEAEFARRPGTPAPRPVNLDPGYMDGSRLVLASTKDNSHRIYLGDGIYAELTLSFRKGAFRHYEWTYPDYRSEQYAAFFEKARLDFLRRRAAARRGRHDD